MKDKMLYGDLEWRYKATLDMLREVKYQLIQKHQDYQLASQIRDLFKDMGEDYSTIPSQDRN